MIFLLNQLALILREATRPLKRFAFTLALLGTVPLTTPIQAQRTHNNIRAVEALRVDDSPKIDGNLNEEIWAVTVPVTTGFRQKEPREGEPASEKTEVRVIYNDESIYFGVVCFDSEPSRVIATELRRDNDLSSDDSFWIILDTFHDHRNSFLFKTNPLGTKFDALVTDEGRDLNQEWDGRWEVGAKITEFGWVAEIEIPFKTLRIIDRREQIWGVDFKRVMPRKNEQVFWSNYDRDFKFEEVSQAGHLIGLDNIETGSRFRVKPFLKVGVADLSQGETSETENLTDVGLEILKYRITPSLSADFTYNTDFAQTEVDRQVVNLTRFPLFFPEKREFFLENAGIFQFGSAVDRRGRADLKLFHSRRIGLSSGGEVIPILGGARVTGKIRGLSLGILNMQSEDLKDIPGSNFGVIRIKRDIFARSSIGAMFTNRQSGEENDFNRVYGFDVNLVFFQNLRVFSFIAKSQTPPISDGEWAWGTHALYDTDFWSLELSRLVIQPNFNPEVGFVTRTDIEKNFGKIAIKPRPGIDFIRQLVLSTRLDYLTDQENVLQSRNYHFFTFEVIFESEDVLRIDNHKILERLDEVFSIRPEIEIPPGIYRGRNISINFSPNPRRKIAGRFGFSQESGFFNGDRVSLNISPRVRLSEKLSAELGYRRDDVSLPHGEFRTSVLNSAINYSFSNKWLTSTMIQYNSADSLFNLNFRLNYIFRSGDDFFLVYNESRDQSGVRGNQTDRSIIAKFTYSFDF